MKVPRNAKPNPSAKPKAKHVPGYGAQPAERAQGLPAAVRLAVREGQPVNRQVEAEPAEGGPDGAVSRRHDDVLHAVQEARGEVGRPCREDLGLGENQGGVEPGRGGGRKKPMNTHKHTHCWKGSGLH